MQLLDNSLVEVVGFPRGCLGLVCVDLDRQGSSVPVSHLRFSGSLSLLHFIGKAPITAPPLFFLKNLFQESLAFALSLQP